MKSKARVLAKKILGVKRANFWARDKQICHTLLMWILQRQARDVLLFCPLSHEVQVLGVARELKKRGIRTWIPRIGKDDKMLLQAFSLPLERAKFGILESSAKNLPLNPKLDIAVVPILAVDSQMRRVGFGKGYYDRFFEKTSCKPYIIFLSRTLIYSKAVLTDPYDVQADAILSSRIKIFKKWSGNGNFRSRAYLLSPCDGSGGFYSL